MYKEDCDSTEDMLCAVNEANRKLRLEPTPGDLAILSMDAEALFPSLYIGDILNGIWRLVLESELEYKNVNVKEIGK